MAGGVCEAASRWKKRVTLKVLLPEEISRPSPTSFEMKTVRQTWRKVVGSRSTMVDADFKRLFWLESLKRSTVTFVFSWFLITENVRLIWRDIPSGRTAGVQLRRSVDHLRGGYSARGQTGFGRS